MFSEKQTSTLTDAIVQDQRDKNREKADQAAKRIVGNLTAYLLNDQIAFDDGHLVGATIGSRARQTADDCAALAPAMLDVAKGIEALGQNHIDGKTDAIEFITGRRREGSVTSGPGVVVDRHTRGLRISRHFEANLASQPYGLRLAESDWPFRVEELQRTGARRSGAAHEVFYNIARDLRVLAAFSASIAQEYGHHRRGRPEGPGRKFFAINILEWYDAAGARLPSRYKPVAKPKAGSKKPRPDLYGLLQALWGPSTPPGLSRDAYDSAHKALRKEGALERFRYDQMLAPDS